MGRFVDDNVLASGHYDLDYLGYEAHLRAILPNAWIAFELAEYHHLVSMWEPTAREFTKLLEENAAAIEQIQLYEQGIIGSDEVDLDLSVRWHGLAHQLHVLEYCIDALRKENSRRKVTSRDLNRFIGRSLVDLQTTLSTIHSELARTSLRLSKLEEEIVPTKMALAAILKDVRRSANDIEQRFDVIEMSLSDLHMEVLDSQKPKKGWRRS